MNTKLCASLLVIGIITASVLLMDTTSSEAGLTAEQKQKTQSTAGWTTFSIRQSGTRVDYPATIFLVSEGKAENGTGERFRTSDARASFSVYSMANDAGETPAVYLRNNLRRPRSALQHERVTSSFFTISEETKDAVYYSRCNFSNDGRIHCFDLIYPLQEKRAWDSVVTRISGSLRPIGSARLAVGHTPEGTGTIRWTTFSIRQSGTRVDYPATIFSVSEGGAENGTGERFRTSDTRASFSVYSMANDAGETPAVYLRNNLRRPRSALQHEQVTSSFFTISEETKDAVYYSRCNFSNDGRIHCFDLIYPLQEKRAWDSVVTRISGSLRPIGSARLAVGHTPEGTGTIRWTTFSIRQSGTRVDYPATIFSVSEGEAENGTGERFRTSDTRASFSVYSMANDAGETPAVYLRNNLRRPRSALQHEQVTSSFFTISEETKDAVYYSRCNFSNDGRIHCFDLIYPLQEKRAWDSVVTRISGSLRPIGSARLAVGHTPEGTKSSPSDLTISDEKHDMKTRDMNKPVRPRMVAKRQATNHTPGKQVPLENRNTSACSDFQTCSGRVAPLFGVGF